MAVTFLFILRCQWPSFPCHSYPFFGTCGGHEWRRPPRASSARLIAQRTTPPDLRARIGRCSDLHAIGLTHADPAVKPHHLMSSPPGKSVAAHETDSPRTGVCGIDTTTVAPQLTVKLRDRSFTLTYAVPLTGVATRDQQRRGRTPPLLPATGPPCHRAPQRRTNQRGRGNTRNARSPKNGPTSPNWEYRLLDGPAAYRGMIQGRVVGW